MRKVGCHWVAWVRDWRSSRQTSIRAPSGSPSSAASSRRPAPSRCATLKAAISKSAPRQRSGRWRSLLNNGSNQFALAGKTSPLVSFYHLTDGQLLLTSSARASGQAQPVDRATTCPPETQQFPVSEIALRRSLVALSGQRYSASTMNWKLESQSALMLANLAAGRESPKLRSDNCVATNWPWRADFAAALSSGKSSIHT